ncbi:AGE family epimerase/isomerase [Caulobacter mirabilis]|uniref:Mannose-1-phosphate guanylyltransferase n=1 Tax=Caulobacter mirabilis TaxID=69666 RepID=A0A2D2B161_9CAUL|nr:AGE family epimerase/isomerase [Caulobacter mirabilis]ATQ43966.1 mannose-1-phosphate guanylyltransferase [Caulobacter mirabilis]
MRIYPVIMCGGAGSRLWPVSRPSRPKQFVSLDGQATIFQHTVERVAALAADRSLVVVSGARYEAILSRQLAEVGLEASMLLEPEPRDSGPAMAAAAAYVAETDPDGIIAVVASDHHVPDADAFRRAIAVAGQAAAEGWIVTLGVRPTGPATAYGYIRPGPASGEVLQVDQFVEKPDLNRALAFLDQGCLWNSGNFVARATTLLEEIARHAPGLAEAAGEALRSARRTGRSIRLGDAFLDAPRISIDYALMEKTDKAAVLPVAFSWSDLGAWDAIHAVGEHDDAGNVVSGNAILVDSHDCLIRNDGPLRVAGVGLHDLAIVAEPDALLICGLDSSQSVKLIVDRLTAAQARELDVPAELTLTAWRDRYEDWLKASALPLWWTLGADFDHGGFHEALDEHARPIQAGRRSRVQTRQAYVYAVAAAQGWSGPWRQAALHGLDFFLAHYAREDGRYAALVAPDGAVLDDTPVLYDQAFALLAMAAVSRIAPERTDIGDRAAALLKGLELMRAPGRGFRENGPWPFQANAQMHLLESALAWFELTGGAQWGELADEIVALALDRFVDPKSGILREVYDETWSPAAGDDGRFIEPGHQFEWAWLLHSWSRLRGDRAVGETIEGLVKAGRAGVDAARDAAVDELWADLSVRSARARLWPQTERLRTEVMMAERGFANATEEAGQAARGLWRYLDTTVPGLWRDKQTAEGDFLEEPAPASSLYHILGAVMALQGVR